MGRNKESWCSGGMGSSICPHGWNIGACTSGGITTAGPFKGFAPGSGRPRYGEMNGRTFKSSDEAFAAMYAHGYGVRYFRGPSYFIYLRLPRRCRAFIAANPRRRVELIRAMLPESDRAHWDAIRRIHGADGHDAEIAKSAERRRPLLTAEA